MMVASPGWSRDSGYFQKRYGVPMVRSPRRLHPGEASRAYKSRITVIYGKIRCEKFLNVRLRVKYWRDRVMESE